MGVINIQVQGSFGTPQRRTFGAQGHGHAQAVAAAIAWLSGEVLPRAVRLDHKLASEGHKPDHEFGAIDHEKVYER